jgi:hypothetical protein
MLLCAPSIYIAPAHRAVAALALASAGRIAAAWHQHVAVVTEESGSAAGRGIAGKGGDAGR